MAADYRLMVDSNLLWASRRHDMAVGHQVNQSNRQLFEADWLSVNNKVAHSDSNCIHFQWLV